MPGTTGQSDSPQEGKSMYLTGLTVFAVSRGSNRCQTNLRTKYRERARAAFLDPRNKGYSAIRARDAAVGADLGGVGGREFKDGMSREAGSNCQVELPTVRMVHRNSLQVP